MKNADNFKNALIDLQEIKAVYEKRGYHFKRLSSHNLDDEIKDYENEKQYGLSEFFYIGPSSCLEWMIGVSLMNGKLTYDFHYFYIFSQDEVHQFKTKNELLNFLKEKIK